MTSRNEKKSVSTTKSPTSTYAHSQEELMLMNIMTGCVASESEWRSEFRHSHNEECGCTAYECAGLVAVHKNAQGKWEM